MATRPPDWVTRTISASPQSVLVMLRRPSSTDVSSQVLVGVVAKAKVSRRDLEVAIREWQPLGIRLEITDTIGSLPSGSLLTGKHEHFVTEVSPDDRHAAASCPVESQRQVARPCAEVEDRRVTVRRNQPGRPPPPIMSSVQA